MQSPLHDRFQLLPRGSGHGFAGHTVLCVRLMVFVKANAFDVVPGSRLMAEEALGHLRILQVRDAHRDHLEVHHVMTWWGLMALGAGL